MNRIDRLTAILIHLQTKRVVKAQELATRFGISLRTVYRDVRALEEAGVPIGAEAGIGYFLENYHLPPVMFTNAEASALVFGAKLMDKLVDASLREPFQSALYKLKSVLKRDEKEHLDDLESQVAVLGRFQSAPVADPLLNQIQRATVQQRVLQIDYGTSYAATITQRDVEPIGMIYYGTGWHLIAYCRLRHDYRDFRTDRIRQLTETGDTFSRQNRLSLQTYLDQLQRIEHLQEAIVWFDRAAARFADSQRYWFGFVEETEHGDRIRMRFLTQYLSGLSRWLLMYGNSITVESPDAVVQEIRAHLQELQVHYAGEMKATLLT